MSITQRLARLIFIRPFTEVDADETRSRGYLSHVLVEVDSERLFPVFFYHAVRLRQDLEESTKHGRPFVADPGMIVVPEVTLTMMEAAVQTLSDEGFFDHLQSVTEERLAAANPYQWPP